MCVYGTHSMRLVQRTSLRQSPADCFAPARPARSMCYFRYFRSLETYQTSKDAIHCSSSIVTKKK